MGVWRDLDMRSWPDSLAARREGEGRSWEDMA